jgi:Flp pilus assembly pilin Flp
LTSLSIVAYTWRVEVSGWSAKALSKACRRRNDESGQTTSEYGIIVGVFAVLLIIAIVVVRIGVVNAFDRGGTEVNAYKPPAQIQCDQHYAGGCLPAYPPDIDCDYLEAHGMPQVTVKDSDPHNLDPDGDGIACN